jgi:hypothetical protein
VALPGFDNLPADNEPVRTRLARLAVALLGLTAIGGACVGCTSGGPPQLTPTASPVAAAAAEPRAELAGRAAAAKDRRYVAAYTWTAGGGPARTVTVTVARDGTWRVDVPGGALGGGANIALVGRRDGVFQCALPPRGIACVRIAKASRSVPDAVDPGVQHVFIDWLDVLTDRQAAFSAAAAKQLAGTTGACYSIEPTTVALQSPIDASILCYDPAGVLTAARGRFGTLVLAGPPAAAPATAALPGPTSPGPPLPVAAPPTASASPSPTPRPSPTGKRK